MSWGARFSILVGVLLTTTAAAMVPSRVFSGQTSLNVFHQSVRLDRNALRSGEILTRRVKSFGYLVFNGRVSRTSDDTRLNQFLATVKNQAIHENWRSLVIDIWVGGKDSPAGYFFRYEGIDSHGVPVQGGAFITTDTAFVKTHLNEYRDSLGIPSLKVVQER